MSVDPAAVAANANAGAAALDALITAELNALAADAQALQQQVAIGDVLNATVLPSNGLSDLISIQGSRVAASLPPTLTPGDQITVQVTGFNGPQILLQILSTSDGAPPSSSGTAPEAPIPIPVSTGTPSTAPSGATLPPSTPVPAPATSSVAPPAAVFVAASVRPNAPVPPPIVPGVAAAEPETDAAPGTIPGAAGTTLPTPVFGGIEARLAAARAASVSVAAPLPPNAARSDLAALVARLPNAPRPPVAPPPVPAAAAGTANAPAATARPFVVPPQIVVTARASTPAPPANAPSDAAGANTASTPPSVARFQDPLALVRALKLPVTPSNLAAAKLALDAPQRLPAALATLESALPESDDPRVATLRTITAFVGKMEPSSPQLAAQIAAYVDHVVTGSEPALAQMLAAHAAESAAATDATAATAGEVADAAATGAASEAPAGEPIVAAATAADAASAPSVPVVAQAQIAERSATIAVSLKEQLFSLVNAPPVSGREAEAIAPSAASALTAVTSVQLAAAQAAAANPQTMTFNLPLWSGNGYTQAQISVDRDAPDTPSVPLDGDNFHIAFVLDTKNLGTVAIDLRTVGRAFSLSVKTETLRTAQRFGDELSRLTDRLSTMRYQPKSVEAVVASSPAGMPDPALEVAVATDAPADAGNADPTGFNERA
jgi:hypothetical protein